MMQCSLFEHARCIQAGHCDGQGALSGRSVSTAMGPRLQSAWHVAVRETKVMLSPCCAYSSARDCSAFA